VTLPPSCFFEGEEEGGGVATLWDNSNIVESYSGVTSPLTFSFASYAYETVNLIIFSVHAYATIVMGRVSN
jgi:pyruvate,water dikinase